MVEPVKPTRAELNAVAGGNQRLLRALEQLFEKSGVETPDQLVVVQSQVAALAAAGNEALARGDSALQVASAALGKPARPPTVPSAASYSFAITPTITTSWTSLVLTSPSTVRDDLAQDMAGFLSSGRLLANDGDWFQVQVNIAFSAGASNTYMRVALYDDSGGGWGRFAVHTHPTLLGTGVADVASFSFLTYTDFEQNSNGWLVQVISDVSVTLTGADMQFARVLEG